jgi:hypothetical protein
LSNGVLSFTSDEIYHNFESELNGYGIVMHKNIIVPDGSPLKRSVEGAVDIHTRSGFEQGAGERTVRP